MLLLVSICTSFTLITSLSLSALCSNGRIKKGGTYFILTRSLGAPLGTSIGICFWLANSVAGGQYIIGALETYIQMGWPLFLEGEG
jgi:solute carrier family 12 sodium/potassium/chloride transporter 2